MAYKRKVYHFPNAIEVEEYHDSKYGNPGERRMPKRKPTREEIERRNQKNKEKKCRRKLRAHFKARDYFVCLTYRKDERPMDMEEAKKHFQRFIRIVKKEYQKRKEELKWIRNIEVGSKNGWHVHLVINRIPDTDLIIANAWEKGKAVLQLMHEKGGFDKLAAYMTKTPKTDSRLRETNYSTSRNLPIPEPIVKAYLRWHTWKKPINKKGYYLQKESLEEGINPCTGFKYRSYTLLRD